MKSLLNSFWAAAGLSALAMPTHLLLRAQTIASIPAAGFIIVFKTFAPIGVTEFLVGSINFAVNPSPMKSLCCLLVFCSGFSFVGAQIPERIVQEWEMLTAHGGTWVADNSAYKNENETADAYAITWTYGLGKTSLQGRLFGITDGKESPTFWEFRMYYHPEEKKLMYQQYGWGGVLGIAEMTLPDATHSSDVATFYNPDGTSYKIKHDNETRNNTQYAQSYQWKDGEWVKQRYYEWVLKTG